jgi:hypothetical protein
MIDERLNLPSASGLERIMLCPGSWLLEQQHGRDEKTADSIKGDRIHAFLAGQIPFTDLTPDEQETALLFAPILAEVIQSTLGIKPEEPHQAVVEERYFLSDPESLLPCFSGKADRIDIHERKALVVDYKTGRNEVTESASNPQLRALAVMTWLEHSVDGVYTAIIQPYAHPKFTVAYYEADDIDRALKELLDTLKASKVPNATRTPGEKQCKYCRAKLHCPEAIVGVESLAVTVVHPQNGEVVSGDQLAALGDRCGQAEAVIASIRAEMRRRLEANPASVPGWKLEENSPIREITDAQRAFQLLSSAGAELKLPALDPQLFVGCCKVKISEVDKLWKNYTGQKSTDAKADLNKRLESVIEKKAKAPSLVRVK